MAVEDHHISRTPRGRLHEPPHQNGDKALVLGAREGNIGGAIAEALCAKGWIAVEDDCQHMTDDGSGLCYEPPGEEDNIHKYDVCIITLGTTHMEPFSEVSAGNFHSVIRGSLGLPLECARRYVQARNEAMGGSGVAAGRHHSTIIFIGSYAHDHPFTHCTSYCVAKAGLDMAARCLAWELMPEGFDVHIIHPHHVQRTPMTEVVRQGMMAGVHKMTAEQAEEYQRKDLRMPDILKPDEVADMVVTLLENPAMRWLSGTAIKMYGGVR